MGISIVAKFLDPTEAQIAAAALRSAGLQAVVMDQQFSAVDWMAMQSLGGIRVGVPDAEIDEAVALLDGLKEAPPEPAEPPAKRGDRRIPALMIGVLAPLLVWAAVRDDGPWYAIVILLLGAAPLVGWSIVAAAKGRGRSSQWQGILLVAGALLAIVAVIAGLDLLFVWLPGALYPNGRG